MHHILLGVRHRGLDAEPLLLRAGIAPALLEAPLARISQRPYAAPIRVLRCQMRCERWGLLQQPLPPGSFGRGMKPLVRCATLGETLREGFAHHHLLLHDFVPRLLVQGGTAQLQMVLRSPATPRLDHGVKAFMLITFNAALWLVAWRIPLLGVDYTEGYGSTGTSRICQVPVRHGQPHVGLSFEAHGLDLPVVQSPQSLREFFAAAPANLTSSSERVWRRGNTGRCMGRGEVAQPLC